MSGHKTRFSLFFFFFFLLSAIKADFFNREQCICVLFTDPQISLLINFFIKNGSTILFTYLKIILLQCFSVFSCIQTDPKVKVKAKNYIFALWNLEFLFQCDNIHYVHFHLFQCESSNIHPSIMICTPIVHRSFWYESIFSVILWLL